MPEDAMNAVRPEPAMPAADHAAPVAVRQKLAVPMTRAGGVTPEMVTFDGLDRPDDFALVFALREPGTPWVRVHSACVTGDLFGSQRCDCGPQLDAALAHLAQHGGVLLYLHQEGRGIGLRAKIEAYALQDQGLDTFAANESLGFPPDARDYASAAQMLLALGIHRVQLLTANPEKVLQLESGGVTVERTQALEIPPTQYNRDYLAAKRKRFEQFSQALLRGR
jgi:GTP cyclohydrolase II